MRRIRRRRVPSIRPNQPFSLPAIPASVRSMPSSFGCCVCLYVHDMFLIKLAAENSSSRRQIKKRFTAEGAGVR